MHCYCCDKLLTPEEAARKFKASKTFTEMCNACLATISDIPTIEGKVVEKEKEEDEDE